MLYHCLRIPLGLLIVGAGLMKLTDVSEFMRSLGDFGLVADELVPAAAWSMILMELIAGLGLAANMRGSLAVVACLLIVFIGVLIYGIALGLDIDCGCLGAAMSVGLKTQLSIDIALVGWCGLVYLTGKRAKANRHSAGAVAPSTSSAGETTS